jgi:hypothetical protein
LSYFEKLFSKNQGQEPVFRGNTYGKQRYIEKLVPDPGFSNPFPPTIDFEVDMVIVLMMGEVMSSGYWLEVNSICEDSLSRLVIDYSKWYPGPDCGIAWVINWPHLIVKCEKTNEDVLFEWNWMEDPCKP